MYLRALEQDDGEYVVWGNLGFAQTYAGDLEGARESLDRAIEMALDVFVEAPGDAACQSDLASYHAMIGERAKALELQGSVIAQDPADPEILITVIETFEILGDRERALEWTERAFAQGMDANELDKDPTLRGLVADERYRSLVDVSRRTAEPDRVVTAGS
jgi:tetratricopeptide (TPR) repeat protein